MAKNLVIVESPAKCKTISKYLGKDFVVKATMGHIIDLPEKEIGIDFEHDFKPKYIISKGRRRVLKVLKDEAEKADTIYLAPDPDREGEAIAWHVIESIGKINGNIKRVMFNEITKKAVVAAIANPTTIDMNKVNAQQARRILDRIVGYQVSPILWRTVFRGLSAGRVQSVALRVICEREDEIKAFKQEEYWSLHVLLQHKAVSFAAKLLHVDGKKAVLPDAQTVKTIMVRCEKAAFVVGDVQKQEKERKPFAPFITSTLQQDSARKLSFSAAKTMLIAQQLYEGLELGELGSMGLITYMRTDSTRIADDALTAARSYVEAQYGKRYLPDAPRMYGKSKNAQDAHEAIRPSQITTEFAPNTVKGFLSKDQFRLYELIWKRFLASQMNNAVYDATRIDINAENYTFRANGSIVKFDGFLTLYDETVEESTETNLDDENIALPDIKVKTAVSLVNMLDKQHFTQPPARYSEATLVRELEDKGIGRPSTYAQIIDTLKKRKYVSVENRRFTPTEVGFIVKNLLVKEFPDVFDVGFTAAMETNLDRVEMGEEDWISVLHKFYDPFSKGLANVKEHVKDLRANNQEVTDRTCPECTKFPLVIKWSRNGRFYACQGFPACKYTEPLEKMAPEKTNEICDKCGAPMVILKINSNRFLGCSAYPGCRNTKSLSIGVKCPREGCEGQLVERRTKRGNIFFGCNAYPKCTFATWDRPVDKKCEACGNPILVYKETKTKGAMHRCPKCRAEYPLPVVPEDGVVAVAAETAPA